MEKDGQRMVRVIVKGAPEYVMPMCNMRLTSQFQPEDMEVDDGEVTIKKLEQNYAKKGLRIFMYAYKDYDLEEFENAKD